MSRRKRYFRLEGALVEINPDHVIIHTDELPILVPDATVGRIRTALDEWAFDKVAARLEAERAEVDRLRRFHDDVEAAWATAAKGRKHPPSPFFFGQKLRRLVREARERYDAAGRVGRP